MESEITRERDNRINNQVTYEKLGLVK
jgi:hypothetical protein